MPRQFPLLAVAALLLAACGSYEGDMRMMCDAVKHVPPTMAPAERAQALSLHIAKNTRSTRARKLFQSLGAADPAGRREVLEAAVREAGIDPASCETLRQFD